MSSAFPGAPMALHELRRSESINLTDMAAVNNAAPVPTPSRPPPLQPLARSPSPTFALPPFPLHAPSSLPAAASTPAASVPATAASSAIRVSPSSRGVPLTSSPFHVMQPFFPASPPQPVLSSSPFMPALAAAAPAATSSSSAAMSDRDWGELLLPAPTAMPVVRDSSPFEPSAFRLQASSRELLRRPYGSRSAFSQRSERPALASASTSAAATSTSASSQSPSVIGYDPALFIEPPPDSRELEELTCVICSCIVRAPLNIPCVTGDHRVLTRRGWVSIGEVVVGDDAMSFDMTLSATTGQFAQEWKRVTRVVNHEVDPTNPDDQLFRMHNAHMDVLATRNHNMLVIEGTRAETRTPEARFVTVGEIERGRFNVPANNKRTRYSNSPTQHVVHAGVPVQPHHKIVVPGLTAISEWWWRRDNQIGFLKFLGFWLGHGHLNTQSGYIVIGQTKESSMLWLIELLDELFPDWWFRCLDSNDKSGVAYKYHILCPPLYEYLRQMAVGPPGYNPRSADSQRSYPHFTSSIELAAEERKSAYYTPRRDGAWLEAKQLAACVRSEGRPSHAVSRAREVAAQARGTRSTEKAIECLVYAVVESCVRTAPPEAWDEFNTSEQSWQDIPDWEDAPVWWDVPDWDEVPDWEEVPDWDEYVEGEKENAPPTKRQRIDRQADMEVDDDDEELGEDEEQEDADENGEAPEMSWEHQKASMKIPFGDGTDDATQAFRWRQAGRACWWFHPDVTAREPTAPPAVVVAPVLTRAPATALPAPAPLLAVVPTPQSKIIPPGAAIVPLNNGCWLSINGHWFHLKRWLGSMQQVAADYSRLSKTQAAALLEGFCRADGRRASVKHAADGTPIGQWRCSSSSFPLVDAIQMIAQLAGANVQLRRVKAAGESSDSYTRRTYFTVDHWELVCMFTPTKHAATVVNNTALRLTQVARPVDVSGNIAARGYHDYNEDSAARTTVYCITVADHANFLTERLSWARSASSKRQSQLKAEPLFIGNCGDVFCGACLTTSYSTRRSCPSCKTQFELKDCHINNHLVKKVWGCKVRCPKHLQGCKAEYVIGVDDRNMKAHVSRCEYVDVSCDFCNEVMPKHKLDAHVNESVGYHMRLMKDKLAEMSQDLRGQRDIHRRSETEHVATLARQRTEWKAYCESMREDAKRYAKQQSRKVDDRFKQRIIRKHEQVLSAINRITHPVHATPHFYQHTFTAVDTDTLQWESPRFIIAGREYLLRMVRSGEGEEQTLRLELSYWGRVYDTVRACLVVDEGEARREEEKMNDSKEEEKKADGVSDMRPAASNGARVTYTRELRERELERERERERQRQMERSRETQQMEAERARERERVREWDRQQQQRRINQRETSNRQRLLESLRDIMGNDAPIGGGQYMEPALPVAPSLATTNEQPHAGDSSTRRRRSVRFNLDDSPSDQLEPIHALLDRLAPTNTEQPPEGTFDSFEMRLWEPQTAVHPARVVVRFFIYDRPGPAAHYSPASASALPSVIYTSTAALSVSPELIGSCVSTAAVPLADSEGDGMRRGWINSECKSVSAAVMIDDAIDGQQSSTQYTAVDYLYATLRHRAHGVKQESDGEPDGSGELVQDGGQLYMQDLAGEQSEEDGLDGMMPTAAAEANAPALPVPGKRRRVD